MTIKLTYEYSKLDKVKTFGLTFKEHNNYQLYIRWIYYYLGVFLGKKTMKYRLYPFDIQQGKLLKEYKFCNDAQLQALLIANKIKSKL